MTATIEIDETLLFATQQWADQRNQTLRQVVESALHTFVEQGHPKASPFRLRQCTFRGHGLQPGIREGDWAAIRELIHHPGAII